MTICYEWSFTVSIIKKNGKRYNNNSLVALGLKYTDAFYDMELILKKRKATLLKVVKVRVLSIAFALKENGEFTQLRLQDNMPDIPELLDIGGG